MKGLDEVIQHLKKIDEEFYGEVTIRVRDGRAVGYDEHRAYRIGEARTGHPNNTRSTKQR